MKKRPFEVLSPLSWPAWRWGLFFLMVFRIAAPGATTPLVDASFDPGLGADEAINAMVIQPDGKILIGGSFHRFDGVNRSGVARLLPNGQLDMTFDPGSGIGGLTSLADGEFTVYALALQSDGKIVVGGEFACFNRIPQNRITRLNPDGSVDSGFNIGTGVSGSSGSPDKTQMLAAKTANDPA